MRGVEIGGAAKNVLAIAAGIVDRPRARRQRAAALTTRGFAELMRFGKAYGAKPETHDGPVRPRRFALDLLEPAVAQFHASASISAAARSRTTIHGGLAEGVFTAPVLLDMARERTVDMPIAAAVAALLDGTMTRGRRRSSRC